MALKDNPIPIGLDLDPEDDDEDSYEKYLALGETARDALRAQYAKEIADSAVAVAKADLVESSREMLEEANRLTRWNWDGDAS